MAGARVAAVRAAVVTAAAARAMALEAKAKVMDFAADQLDIDFRQQLGIEQRAVLGARRIVDPEPAAERIKRGLRPGELLARHADRVDGAAFVDAGPAGERQLCVDKAHIERSIMNDQRRIADEIHEVGGDIGEHRMTGEEVLAQSMDPFGLGGHVPFRVDVLMIDLAGRHMIQKLHATDFDDPVTRRRIETRGFRIENDFPHAIRSLHPEGGPVCPLCALRDCRNSAYDGQAVSAAKARKNHKICCSTLHFIRYLVFQDTLKPLFGHPGAGEDALALHAGRPAARGTIEMLAVTDDGAWIAQTPRIPMKANGSGDVTAALFTAHYGATGDAALALARTVSSVFDLLQNTYGSGERELQLIESQEVYAHPRMQFEVARVR